MGCWILGSHLGDLSSILGRGPLPLAHQSRSVAPQRVEVPLGMFHGTHLVPCHCGVRLKSHPKNKLGLSL